MQVVREPGSLVVRLEGDIDWSATLTVEPKLEELTSEPGLSALTLDLSDVTFVDSTGVRLILVVAERCRALGIELEIVPPEPSVFRVFEVVKLDESLPFRRPSV